LLCGVYLRFGDGVGTFFLCQQKTDPNYVYFFLYGDGVGWGLLKSSNFLILDYVFLDDFYLVITKKLFLELFLVIFLMELGMLLGTSWELRGNFVGTSWE
jgi:hypothetical protein